MSKIIGIDLGTTFSAVAVMQNGEPQIIENKEGTRTTPSIVALGKNNERLVGIIAKRQQITNPVNTIYSAKRLIGRRFSDAQVQEDKKLLSYQIREAGDGGVEIKMGENWHKPAEISAMILAKIKSDVESKIGEPVKEAVITCPAYFDDSQRKATKVAGEIAGLDVKMVLNEPTAAALAYGLTKTGNQQILVYDFGGGTFDVSILDVRKDPDTLEVIGVGGDTHLGGDDFDQKIMNWVITEYKKEQGVDLSGDQLALQRIKEAAEKAKIELSTTLETEINIPFITSDSSGPKHLYLKLTRAKFEDLVREYIDRSIELVKETLQSAKLETKDIEEVVLVGGQTRTPAINLAVGELFGKEPNKSINPDEVVAIGAAVQAGVMSGDAKEVLLLDATPLSVGIETLGNVNTILIPKNTIYPVSKTQVFSTAADNQPSVDIHVLQGERTSSADNKTLGRFILDGIPPSPRGVPQVEVTFDIDSNGILNVSAKDKASGKTQSIKIEGSLGISQEEIDRMKADAQAHADSDKKKKELVEAQNMADQLIYTWEKTEREQEDKIDENTKKEIKEKIEELKKAKEGDDIDTIKTKTGELSALISKAGSNIYSQDQKKDDQREKPAGNEPKKE